MADDIVAIINAQLAICQASPCDCTCPILIDAAVEIERLRAELEQTRLNLQHARTGKALLELEQERARTADLRNAFSELAELCQRLLTERFNDMTEGAGDTLTPTLPATDTTAR